MIMKKLLLLFPLLLSCLWGIAADEFRVAELRCEYRDNPLAINTLTPQFSWQTLSVGRGFLQAGYQIQVASDPADLARGRKLLWDEQRKSDVSLHVRYAGRTLKPGQRYYWRVRVSDAAGNYSPWSEIRSFAVGLLDGSDWDGARWIAFEELPDSLRVVPGQEFNKIKIGDRKTALNRLPQFRREVKVTKPVERATVYVSGLGQFELFLNGAKVGDNFLDPAWSDYDRQVCYQTFDISEELQPGGNVFGVMLGNGLYNVPRERYFKALISFGYPKMIFKAEIEYADGTHETIVSDRAWRVTESPVTYSSIFGGEDYDATRERTGWCTAPQKLDTFGVFFMKYNYEIRLKAVKLVLEGGLSVREAGCHLGCGRSQVHLWVTLFERHGLAGLKLRHGSYSAEFKLSVLKHMHQNHLSLLETAVHFGIPGPFVIRQWERLYQNQGAEGLRRKPQRRRPAMSKSKTKKVKLKTTPHEELLKELEYLRAENAYLKKLQALVEERIVRESGKEPKPSKD